MWGTAIVPRVRGDCFQMMHITCNHKEDIMKTVKPEMLSKQTLPCVCYWTLLTQKTLCNYCCIHRMSWLVPKTLLAPIQWSQIHRRSNIKVQLVDRTCSTKVYNFIWLSSVFLASLLSPVLYPPFSIRPPKPPHLHANTKCFTKNIVSSVHMSLV